MWSRKHCCPLVPQDLTFQGIWMLPQPSEPLHPVWTIISLDTVQKYWQQPPADSCWVLRVQGATGSLAGKLS